MRRAGSRAPYKKRPLPRARDAQQNAFRTAILRQISLSESFLGFESFPPESGVHVGLSDQPPGFLHGYRPDRRLCKTYRISSDQFSRTDFALAVN